jgi:hypothetical protein
MRVASRKDPQIVLTNIADKHSSIRIRHSDVSMTIKNISPLIGGVPVEFAVAAGGDPNVDTGDKKTEGRAP